jgi:hypothetical protein
MNSGGSNKNNYKPSKKTLSDHIYYLGSAKQAEDYDATMDFFLNHIIKTFTFGNDITTALGSQDGKDYNIYQHKPKLKPAISRLSADDKAVTEKQNKMEFKEEFSA